MGIIYKQEHEVHQINKCYPSIRDYFLIGTNYGKWIESEEMIDLFNKNKK